MTILGAGAIAALGPFIEYLRPAKSPYLLMVIFGTAGIVVTGGFFNAKPEWLMLAVPQVLALIIFTLFAYYGRDEHNLKQQEGQLRFSRAISIATALMCLVFGSRQLAGTQMGLLFNWNYFICLFQLAVFTVYSAARLFKEEEEVAFNFFQFSFITSVYLAGATFSMVNIDYSDNSYLFQSISNGDTTSKVVDSFFATSLILYVFWCVCQVYWIKRVVALIRISVV